PLVERGVQLADDGGVERALVRKVVIDHRLVDAGAAGDAVHGGGGKAPGAELVARGGQDAAAGAWGGRCGGFAGHGLLRPLLTDRLVNSTAPAPVKSLCSGEPRAAQGDGAPQAKRQERGD